GPGPKKSRGTSAEGRCISDRKEMRDASQASQNVPIARHVTVRSQAPCASQSVCPLSAASGRSVSFTIESPGESWRGGSTFGGSHAEDALHRSRRSQGEHRGKHG